MNRIARRKIAFLDGVSERKFSFEAVWYHVRPGILLKVDGQQQTLDDVLVTSTRLLGSPGEPKVQWEIWPMNLAKVRLDKVLGEDPGHTVTNAYNDVDVFIQMGYHVVDRARGKPRMRWSQIAFRKATFHLAVDASFRLYRATTGGLNYDTRLHYVVADSPVWYGVRIFRSYWRRDQIDDTLSDFGKSYSCDAEALWAQGYCLVHKITGRQVRWIDIEKVRARQKDSSFGNP